MLGVAGPAALVFGLGFLLRLLTAPTAVDSLDALFFVRGLGRYSVLELRPHWPGYPVYLAAARVVRWMLGDAEASLRVVSLVASAATAWPLMAVVHDWRLAGGATRKAARLGSILAGLLWILAPLSWLVGTEIGSDPLGLLAALVALLLCTRALCDSASDRALLGAAALAGLLLGIRLPYAALLLPVGDALRRRIGSSSSSRSSRRLLLACVFAAAVPVATWLGWQVAADGAGYLEMARSRLAAHYGNWTERVLAHGHCYSRPAALVRVLAVDGLGGWWPGLPLARVAVTMGWLALIVAGVRRLSGHALARRALLLWAVPYLVMILLFNDVALSRYALPLLAALCLVAEWARPPARPRRSAPPWA